MTSDLARRGASVVVADIDIERASQHADAIVSEGGSAMAVELDVASEQSVSAAFAAVEAQFGAVDILVNNASPSRLVAQDTAADRIPLEIWDAIFSVIVRGALLCCQRALPSMIRKGAGSIISIASIHALSGDPDLTAYPAAKAALVGLSRTVATQYGWAGVRANSITLGTIPHPNMSAAARQSRVRHQLVPREGLPDDVANLVSFLAAPVSSFLTGANYAADGGILAHLPSYADGGTFDLMRSSG